MRNGKRKVSLFLLICIITITMFGSTFPSYAKDDQTQTDAGKEVKVGYVLSTGYQEGNEGEYKSGYGYEHLQKIAGYAGWTYVYEYGTFSDLLKKLEDGEIDLLGNLTFTEDEATKIFYGTLEQGKENYYLYVNGTASGITGNDFTTINGKKIGVNAGSYQGKLWENWCADHNIQCEIVEFDSAQERQNALNDGSIDGTVGSLLINKNDKTKNWRVVLKYGEIPYYFGINKSRPDLLQDLNEAQEMILDECPNYNEKVSTYTRGTDQQIQTQLSDKEIQWLEKKDGNIRIGCLDNYLPLSAKDDETGEMKGVIPDLLNSIEDFYSEYHVNFEAVVYDDYQQMVADLKNGSIDMAAPIYGDSWIANEEGVALTNSFMSTTMLLISNKEYVPDNVKKIGIDIQSPIQVMYAKIYYPTYEIKTYSSMSDVSKAVVKGEVDAALCTACSYHIMALNDRNLGNLSRATLPGTVNLAMAVSKQNPQLMSFLNRAIAKVGSTEIFNSLAIHSNVDKKVTLVDFISANPVMALIVSVIIIVALGMIILRMMKAIQKARTDSMTGLLNKIAMQECIRDNIARGGVLFMIDIDNFKQVNDVLGHDAGDQVINCFSTGLKRTFRTGDIIGRFGGDEFMVFLPGSKCSESTISGKVDQIQDILKHCDVLVQNKNVKCSASVGILCLEAGNSIGFEEAFAKVDAALYEAKNRGKATYVMAD